MGSMLTTIKRAIAAGYAVAVLNPNTNSVSARVFKLLIEHSPQ